jgi:tRNA (guanine-N7-)-methyltransferase
MSEDWRKNETTRGFFGRRRGHALRPRQAALFETLLPRLAIDLTQPAPQDLTALFPLPLTDVGVEIGFGGGEYMVAMAQSDPQCGIIGCEAFVNGMAKALAAIDAFGLANVRIHHGDALELIAWLPDASLARVDVLYPDPWPKRRHWRRRFMQDGNIDALARVLRPGGELRFATDMADYAAWTLIRLLRSPAFEWLAEQADDWRKPWPDFVRTRYESKAVQAGRLPCYLRFRRCTPS